MEIAPNPVFCIRGYLLGPADQLRPNLGVTGIKQQNDAKGNNVVTFKLLIYMDMKA